MARFCGLSLSALVEFAHGVTSISVTQQAAIAKFIGLGDGSVSGLTIIREAMERRCRNGRPDWGLTSTTRNRVRSGGRTVDPNDESDTPSPEIEDDSLSLRHTANVQAFLAGDDQAVTLDEINAFLAPGAYYDPEIDRLRKIDTATVLCTARPPPAKGRPIEELTAGMERMQDVPGYRPIRGPITIYDPSPLQPARGPLPGWA